MHYDADPAQQLGVFGAALRALLREELAQLRYQPASAPGEPLAVTIGKAAELLGVGHNAVYNLINSGDLPSFKIGNSRRISYAALRAYVESRLQAEIE